jgi:hypothetical protein
MPDHSECRDVLKLNLAIACGNVGEPDMDLVISTEPPLIRARPGQWQPLACTCVHGTTYWIEPTGEQRAKWRARAAS